MTQIPLFFTTGVGHAIWKNTEDESNLPLPEGTRKLKGFQLQGVRALTLVSGDLPRPHWRLRPRQPLSPTSSPHFLRGDAPVFRSPKTHQRGRRRVAVIGSKHVVSVCGRVLSLSRLVRRSDDSAAALSVRAGRRRCSVASKRRGIFHANRRQRCRRISVFQHRYRHRLRESSSSLHELLRQYITSSISCPLNTSCQEKTIAMDINSYSDCVLFCIDLTHIVYTV